MKAVYEQNESIERPVQVLRAVQMLFASFGLGLVAATIAVILQLSGLVIFVALIPLALFFGLALFLVRKISAGRNWARVTLLVIVLVGVPFAIPTYAEEIRRNVLSGGLSIFIAALQLFGTAFALYKELERLVQVAQKHNRQRTYIVAAAQHSLAADAIACFSSNLFPQLEC